MTDPGLSAGRLGSTGPRSVSGEAMVVLTVDQVPPGWTIEIGQMVAVSAVEASNIVKDVRELVTNAFGGRMRRYEQLLAKTVDSAMDKFRAELALRGYDGALGVRLQSPTLVHGGAELIIYGTGFRFAGSGVGRSAGPGAGPGAGSGGTAARESVEHQPGPRERGGSGGL
ncbi:MAG: heavy metal-binding domain-containing protein [Pseudomonadota bacterium]